MVFYLGALQYHWDDKFIEWYSDELYFPRGSALGSHAVVIRRSAFLWILRYAKQMSLPIDDGALSAVCHKFPRRCVVAYPNLVIQDSSLESTIQSSKLHGTDFWNRSSRFHWNLSDYSM